MICAKRWVKAIGAPHTTIVYDNMRDLEDHPRSFRLSHGRSDLWILLGVFVFGAIELAIPAAGPWIMRVMLIAAEVLLLVYIGYVRRLREVVIWRSSLGKPIGAVIGLAVLGIWIWYLAKGFLAGKWIDASISSILVSEFAYLEWLKARHGRAGI
jgi:hypothetical protein